MWGTPPVAPVPPVAAQLPGVCPPRASLATTPLRASSAAARTGWSGAWSGYSIAQRPAARLGPEPPGIGPLSAARLLTAPSLSYCWVVGGGWLG